MRRCGNEPGPTQKGGLDCYWNRGRIGPGCSLGDLPQERIVDSWVLDGPFKGRHGRRGGADPATHLSAAGRLSGTGGGEFRLVDLLDPESRIQKGFTEIQ